MRIRDGLSRLRALAGRRLLPMILYVGIVVVTLLCLNILSTQAGLPEWERLPHDNAQAAEPLQASGLARPISVSGSYTVYVYLPFVTSRYTPPFCNGDFEILAGDFASCWERGGNLSVTITTTNCYSGIHCALLSDPNYPCNGIPKGHGQISQIFGVPPTGTPKLSFYYRIFSYDEFTRFDSFEVYIDDIFPDDTPPIRLLIDGSQDGKYGCDKSDLDITPWEKSPVFDLSAIPDGAGGSIDYRGKAVLLSFYVYSHEWPEYPKAWYNTWVYVDNVQIEEGP